MNVCMHIFSHAHMYTYIHTYIDTYIHRYIHTYIDTYIHTYMHTHIHTQTHTYSDTYTDTNIHKHPQKLYLSFHLNPCPLPLYGSFETLLPSLHRNKHTPLREHSAQRVRTCCNTSLSVLPGMPSPSERKFDNVT